MDIDVKRTKEEKDHRREIPCFFFGLENDTS